MKILSFKSGQGGALAAIDATRGSLLFSYEAEKDSFPKNSSATADTFMDGAEWFDELPDILAISGTARTGLEYASEAGAGYFGLGPGAQQIRKKRFFGRLVDYYSSSHERAHIWSAYALSPLPQGAPCHVLVWDDVLGDFYRVDEGLAIHHQGRVMGHPAHRFASALALADPQRQGAAALPRDGDFGRLMALAASGDEAALDPDADALIALLLAPGRPPVPADNPFRGIGTDTQRFRNLAAKLSDAIFRRFHDYARDHLDPGLPLLIAGEGALNCDWTTRWQQSGLFADVFTAPTAGDTGCAIGTAVDAMRHFTGRAKLVWSVYAGQPFQDDAATLPALNGTEINFDLIAAELAAGRIIGWASGNCEIGPRALGNRSILGAPFDPVLRARMNRIKGRPEDAPISPVCLAEDAALHFTGPLPSPHMLFLQRLTDPRLVAVAHSDGSSRLQTVTEAQHPMLYRLLLAFKRQSGVGVLCNTSLNFPGAGFINKTSDLCHFAGASGLDGFVAGIRYYRS